MPGWNDLLNEIQNTAQPNDFIRRKYLKQYAAYVKRNVICYYSSWLNKPSAPNLDINDSDMTGFMNAIKGMDCSKGLD